MVNIEEYMMMLPPEIGQQVGSFYGRGRGRGRNTSMPGQASGYGNQIGSYNPNNPYANINPYRYSGMDSRESPGDQLLADLIRAQTRDYQTRYAPIENRLAGAITRTGTTFLPEELERTRGSILGAAENVQGMANRSANRLGVRGAEMEQNDTTSTLVGGLNETRMRDQDRRLQLLTGGLSGITQSVRNIG